MGAGQGIKLHEEYPVPPPPELIEHWQGYTLGEVVEAPGVFSLTNINDKRPY